MRQKTLSNLLLLVLLFSFFTTLGIHTIFEKSRLVKNVEEIVSSDGFRAQKMSDAALQIMRDTKDPSRTAALWLLETRFGNHSPAFPQKESEQSTYYESRLRFWEQQENFAPFLKNVKAIWQDVRYFPVVQPEQEEDDFITFVNSWMEERSFGGKRGHEGTDIMTQKDIPGKYPVISMTDGIVSQMGWLQKGGYRIGITAPHGGYYYYAHLDSYAGLKEGDQVRAGDLLGFAGNTGYGPEGTRGQFPTHLHVGIYLYPKGEEISVNPYWVLKYLEPSKLTCANKADL